MKNFLLFMKSAMYIVISALLVSVVFSCSKDDDPDPTPPKPTPILVKGLNFKSAVASDTKFETVGLKLSKTENITAIFTIFTDDNKTRDTTVVRTGMKASAEVVLPTEIPAIKTGATLGTLAIKKSLTKAANVISTNDTYEIAGFANEMKIVIKTTTDSSFVNQYGKEVELKYGSELVPVEVTYKNEEAVVQDVINIVDGVEFVNVLYTLNVKFKDEKNEKVLPVEVTIPFNRSEFDPEIGERSIDIKTIALGDKFLNQFRISIQRKSGNNDLILEEVETYYGFSSDAENVIYAKTAEIVPNGSTEKEVKESSFTRGRGKIYKTENVYTFKFVGFNSKISTFSEIAEVEIKGIKYQSSPTPLVASYVEATEFSTTKNQETGYKTTLMGLKFYVENSFIGTTSAIQNDVYIKVKNDNIYNINLEATQKLGGFNPSFMDRTPTDFCIVVYGSREKGNGGVAVFLEGRGLVKFTPWVNIKDKDLPLGVIQIEGTVYLSYIKTSGSNLQYIWADAAAPDNPLYETIGSVTKSTVTENNDGSVTIKNGTNTINVRGL